MLGAGSEGKRWGRKNGGATHHRCSEKRRNCPYLSCSDVTLPGMKIPQMTVNSLRSQRGPEREMIQPAPLLLARVSGLSRLIQNYAGLWVGGCVRGDQLPKTR